MEWILLILGLFLIFLVGCKKPVKPTITEVQLLVPYENVKGKDYCMPASAVMVFSYYGEDVSQLVIAGKVIKNGSASTFKLVSYARELGYFAAWKRTSMEEIEGYLREGIPLIVIQKYSLTIKNSHCRVITGFNSVKAELTLHDSVDGNNYKMSCSEFFELGFDSTKMSQIIVIRR